MCGLPLVIINYAKKDKNKQQLWPEMIFVHLYKIFGVIVKYFILLGWKLQLNMRVRQWTLLQFKLFNTILYIIDVPMNNEVQFLSLTTGEFIKIKIQ